MSLRSTWVDLIPGPLVRYFARPYVAGDSIESALEVAADRFRQNGSLATLDLLGEDVTTAEQVTRNVDIYKELIERIPAQPGIGEAATRASVSLKPSAFTAGSRDDARRPLVEIVHHARKFAVPLTIDMEDRNWTDFTLDLSCDLFEQGFDVGTVVQTRLQRTRDDLERLPAGMRVRLVIGIYPEPAEIAITSKVEMKRRMVDYAARLLERGIFVEFATHDEATLATFLREVAPAAPDRCEIQMLLGVPRFDFLRGLAEGRFGVTVGFRRYVPFAVGWEDATAYLRRRMVENPGMSLLVLRNLWQRR